MEYLDIDSVCTSRPAVSGSICLGYLSTVSSHRHLEVKYLHQCVGGMPKSHGQAPWQDGIASTKWEGAAAELDV